MATYSCFFFIDVVMDLAIALGKYGETTETSSHDVAFAWMFVIMGSIFTLSSWAISICIIVAGRKLKQRKSRIFCMVVAGIECMFMPFGTVLGVFTFIALNKDSIKETYAQNIEPTRYDARF